MPNPGDVKTALDAIEAELKTIGWWSSEPLADEAFENMGPFGQNTMAYSQWLQFVFIPAARQAIETGSFPTSSSVGTKAIREFDGLNEAGHLTDLLCRFDDLFR